MTPIQPCITSGNFNLFEKFLGFNKNGHSGTCKNAQAHRCKAGCVRGANRPVKVAQTVNKDWQVLSK